MIFRELNWGKCKTYLAISEASRKAAVIDPLHDKIERYLAVLAYHRWCLEAIVDTHTHADHRSGALVLGELAGAPVVMHRLAPAPHVSIHVEDGQALKVGNEELRVLHTPGHTPDSISLLAKDRVFTGDVLFIHGTGRSDFAGGEAGIQYDSIMRKLFTLPDETLVYPAHDYRGHTHSTIGEEKRSNPRLAGRSREEYIDLMNNLGLPLPEGIQEALQPNQSDIDAGALKFPTLAQLNQVRQLSAAELHVRLASATPPILIDIREEDEYRGELGHIAGAHLIPLKQLPERVDEFGYAKGRDIVAICRVGVRSATAAAILTGLGFEHVWNLKGGMIEWADARLPVER
ncbi:MAG TPA: MBL fold metallo-hydrolase [Candidatus Binataceae bacterium]|nr:MBL fold metallo-hydrolase [Candidatus Binataceae bacterium]